MVRFSVRERGETKTDWQQCVGGGVRGMIVKNRLPIHLFAPADGFQASCSLARVGQLLLRPVSTGR